MCTRCFVATNSSGHFKAVAPVSPMLDPHHETRGVVGIASYKGFSRDGTDEQGKVWVTLQAGWGQEVSTFVPPKQAPTVHLGSVCRWELL